MWSGVGIGPAALHTTTGAGVRAGAEAGGGGGGGAGAGAGGDYGYESSVASTSHLVVSPGEGITSETGFLRGHGTYVSDEELVASLAGVVERVNKLVSVRPLNTRYTGEVGDVVVGRIREVGSKRWKVDINSRQDAVLMLSSVNLSGGVQRRRTYEDQLQMRSFLSENDLISADVHSFYGDGAISLHARSLKYGKLENGTLVVVPPALVPRLKQHFVTLPCDIDVILGNNGYIWVTETLGEEDADIVEATTAETLEARRKKHAEKFLTAEARLRIARVRNSILALRFALSTITPDTILAVYNKSMELGMAPKDMLNPDSLRTLTAGRKEELDEDGEWHDE